MAVGKRYKIPVQTKPKYENCKVFSPSGDLMFRCAKKKLEWYLLRNLAERVDEFSIKLIFEPNGRGHVDQPYYLEDRENMCVICGKKHGLILHHVVPHMYRKWMPDIIKDHSCHDTLLVCVDCHEDYELHATKLKHTFAEKYKIPVNGAPWILHPERKPVISASKALHRLKDRLPQARVLHLENTLKSHFGVEEIDDDILQRGIKLVMIEKGDSFKEHGEAVIGSMCMEEIVDFVRVWRAHFLEHVKPRYLSDEWSVENDVIKS